jgi:hypothetical protein
MAKPNFGKGRDGIYKAIGEGERTSKKVATIRKTDGTTFRRKNANQYGSAQGDNDYYEDRPDRSDKYGKGGDILSSKKYPSKGVVPETTYTLERHKTDDGGYFYPVFAENKFKKSWLGQGKTEEEGRKILDERLSYIKETDEYAKGSTVLSKKKEPKIVRGFSDDEEYEYGQGGTTSGFNYSIGGL